MLLAALWHKKLYSFVSLNVHFWQLFLLCGLQPAKVKVVTRIYSQRRERQHTILYQCKLQIKLHYKAHSFADVIEMFTQKSHD